MLPEACPMNRNFRSLAFGGDRHCWLAISGWIQAVSARDRVADAKGVHRVREACMPCEQHSRLVAQFFLVLGDRK